MLVSNAFAQTKTNSLGLPGDNFDLYGTLELFKKADTPENFENAIHSTDNGVNHLDLDGDGKTDYVRVVAKKDSDVHAFALQVAVSASEMQNVAVIEMEKTGNDKTHVRMVGDEELYGKNYIIESEDEKEIVTAERTVNDNGSEESDDDVYATSDKSGSTSMDFSVIEPVFTKVAYFMVEEIIVPVAKDVLHNMGKSIVDGIILALKAQ